MVMEENGSLRYPLTDHQGSVVSVLNDEGDPMSHQRYMPFGAVRPDLTGTNGHTDFGYTGQREMNSIGLMDYKARFYDPSIGRFIQPDTIVSNPVNPQTWNRYSYVSNNPINNVDPTGHCFVGGHELPDSNPACSWTPTPPTPPTPTTTPTTTPTNTATNGPSYHPANTATITPTATPTLTSTATPTVTPSATCSGSSTQCNAAVSAISTAQGSCSAPYVCPTMVPTMTATQVPVTVKLISEEDVELILSELNPVGSFFSSPAYIPTSQEAWGGAGALQILENALRNRYSYREIPPIVPIITGETPLRQAIKFVKDLFSFPKSGGAPGLIIIAPIHKLVPTPRPMGY